MRGVDVSMSWDAYISGLTSSGFSRAAILGFNGAVWAASPNLVIPQEEGRVLVDNFHKPSQFVKDGVRVGGQEFYYVRNSDRTVFAKRGIDCVLAVRTNKAVLVGLFSGQPSAPSAAIERLADYLIGQQM